MYCQRLLDCIHGGPTLGAASGQSHRREQGYRRDLLIRIDQKLEEDVRSSLKLDDDDDPVQRQAEDSEAPARNID
jgi:hypothetical protein